MRGEEVQKAQAGIQYDVKGSKSLTISQEFSRHLLYALHGLSIEEKP